jgi:hypothetical protein
MSIWLNEYTGNVEDLAHEMDPRKFDERFNTSYTFGSVYPHDLLFLDNGDVVDRKTWNGDEYLDGNYIPVVKEIDEDTCETVGYEKG